MKFGFTPEAEILNGRLAMLGFVIAVGTYLTTGQILPGVFQYIILLKTLQTYQNVNCGYFHRIMRICDCN